MKLTRKMKKKIFSIPIVNCRLATHTHTHRPDTPQDQTKPNRTESGWTSQFHIKYMNRLNKVIIMLVN